MLTVSYHESAVCRHLDRFERAVELTTKDAIDIEEVLEGLRARTYSFVKCKNAILMDNCYDLFIRIYVVYLHGIADF